MNNERCSKCCFDLKDTEIMDKCEIACKTKNNCKSKIMSCYTRRHIF